MAEQMNAKAASTAKKQSLPKAIRPQIRVTNRPNYHHVNFLVHAAAFAKRSTVGERLSQFYSKSAIAVKQKGRVRLHPSFKRNVCKRCRLLLTADTGWPVHIRRVAGRQCLVARCAKCGTSKRHALSGSQSLKIKPLPGKATMP